MIKENATFWFRHENMCPILSKKAHPQKPKKPLVLGDEIFLIRQGTDFLKKTSVVVTPTPEWTKQKIKRKIACGRLGEVNSNSGVGFTKIFFGNTEKKLIAPRDSPQSKPHKSGKLGSLKTIVMFYESQKFRRILKLKI